MNLGENGTTSTTLCMYQYCAATTNYALYCGVFDPDFGGFSTDQSVNLKLIHSTTSPKQVLIAAYGTARDGSLVLVQKDNNNWDLYSAPAAAGSDFTSKKTNLISSASFINYFVTSKDNPKNVYSMQPGGAANWYKTTTAGSLTFQDTKSFSNTVLRLFEDIVYTSHPDLATGFSVNIDISGMKFHHGYTARLDPLVWGKDFYYGLESYCKESNADCFLYSANQYAQGSLFTLDNKTINEKSTWAFWNERGIETGTKACNNSTQRYVMIGTLKFCYKPCPSFLPMEYPISSNDIQCVNGCGIGTPPSDPYEDGSSCVKSCSGLMTPTSGAYTANEKGVCGACAASEFSLAETGAVYSDGNPKKYCITECPSSHHITVEDASKSCTDSCDPAVATATFDTTFNMVYLDDTTSKTSCLQTCPTAKPYGLEPTGQIGNCYLECPTSHPLAVESSNKSCTDSCDSTAATAVFNTAFDTLYLDDTTTKSSCVKNCPTAKPRKLKETGQIPVCHATCPSSHPITVEDTDKSCTDSCDPAVATAAFDTTFNLIYTDATTSDTSCVLTCPTAKPRKLKQPAQLGICHLTCPSSHPITVEDTDKSCTDSCDPAVATATFDTTFNLIYTDATTSDTSCVLTCPTAKPRKLKQPAQLGICHLTCPSSHPITVEDTDKSCTDSCDPTVATAEFDSTFNLIHTDDTTGDVSCVLSCPTAKPRKLKQPGQLGTCHLTCPTSHPIIVEDAGLSCTDSCDPAVATAEFDSTFNLIYTDDTTGDTSCVLTCPIEKPKKLKQPGQLGTCHAECPSSHPFSVEDADKSCTDSCDPTVATADFDATFNMAYTDTTTGKSYCVQVCPAAANKQLQIPGQITSCYADCPASHPMSVPDFNNSCTDSCDSSVATATFDSTYDLIYLDDSTGKPSCVLTCPTDKNYLNRPSGETGTLLFTTGLKGTCENICPEAEPYNYKNSGMHFCVTQCSGSKSLYLKTTNKCVSSCTFGEPDLHEDGYCYKDCIMFEGQCVDKCPDSHPFVLMSKCATSCNSGHYVENYDFDTTLGGTCLEVCDSYILSFYHEGHRQTLEYCLNECPVDYKIAELSSSDRRCVSDCSEVPSLKYLAGTKCVASCMLEGFNYIDPDNVCLNDCAYFVDRNVFCVVQCPPERHVSHLGNCMPTCPEDYPFLERYLYCTDKCPVVSYDQFCVDSCDDEELTSNLARYRKPFEERPFVLSNGACSTDCSEPDFPYKNLASGQCLSKCPNSMRFADEENVCRSSCKGSLFPFKHRPQKKCLRQCSEDRPFFRDEKFVCLAKCPRRFPIILRQRQLGDLPVLPGKQRYNICSDSCGEDAPIMMEVDGLTICLESCPQFYTEVGGMCVLNCTPQFGLIPNETKDGCYSCQGDFGQFYFGGKCVDSCPRAFMANVSGVCKSCISLNLWIDPEGNCVTEAECMKYSNIDVNNKTCSNCEGINKFVVIFEGGDPQCVETSCSTGIIEDVKGTKYCYICGENKFFFDKKCLTSCPSGFVNDFTNFTCVRTCPNDCSELCCSNSDVCSVIENKTDCECKKGFFGMDCKIEEQKAPVVSDRIFKYMDYKFKESAVTQQDIQSIIQYYYLSNAPTRRLLNEERQTLLSNLRNYVQSNYVQYAFQPHVLNGIDAYLLLSLVEARESQDFKPFEEMSRFLIQVAREIQEFLIKFNTVANFEVINEGIFKGTGFELQFGPDASSLQEINLTNCVKKVEAALETDKVQFRLFKLNPDVLAHFPFPAGNMFFDPTFYVELFAAKNVLDLNLFCSAADASASFSPKVNSETKERIGKLTSFGFNLFDVTSPFFIDRCVKFADEDKDVSLNQRNAEYFVDPSQICNETPLNICTVDRFDAYNNPICSCRGIGNQSKSSQKPQSIGYPSSNYILFMCLETFRNSEWMQNVGLYMVFLPFILLFSLATYEIFTTDRAIMSSFRFRYIRNDMMLFDPNRMVAEVYFRECAELQNNIAKLRRKVRLMRLNLIKEDNSKKDAITALPTLRDMENLSFEEQVKQDNRSLFGYAIDIFNEHHALFYAFTRPSLIFPKYFRISLFLTELNLQTMLNAFFIDDAHLDAFNAQSDPNIFFSLTNEATKIFWAVFTSKLLGMFLLLFYRVSTVSKRRFMRRMMCLSPEYLRAAFNKYMLEQRLSTILFTFLVIVYNLACAYFVIIYAEIFANSMSMWINGIIIGWIADLLLVETLIPSLFVFARFVYIKTGRHTWIYSVASKLRYVKNLSADI